VFKVLGKRFFVELGEELSRNRDIMAADVINQLTLIHWIFTFIWPVGYSGSLLIG
jgi:hypothetical protein